MQPDLDRIQAIRDRDALETMLAKNLGTMGASPMEISGDFDRKVANTMIVSIETRGMSLPARELYVEPAYEPLRKLHREHIARLLALAGKDDVVARAIRVEKLESAIAQLSWTPAQMRDQRKMYNPVSVNQLPIRAPGIDWPRFLSNAGLVSVQTVNIKTPSAVAGMAQLIATAPLEEWRDYLSYALLVGSASHLPKPFSDEVFSFYGKVLSGQPEPDPRWKVVLFGMAWVSDPLADPLGKVYAERYVSPDSQPVAREMIDNIIAAFDARLATLQWMTPRTRAGAREKLAKLTIKAISPEVRRSVDDLRVVRGDALGNAREMKAYKHRADLAWIADYPDRRMFLQPDFMVNAYANPAWNEIVFLSAIVQPPFFDPKADKAVNYGAMGAVIGHEISHLFDDQGRNSDADGLLRDWWTKADADKFTAVANRLSAQVGAYEVLPGKFVNGPLALGESIADVAGLTVSYDAYRRSLNGKEPPVLDGFTGDQRFFLAYAQAWRSKPRDAYLDQLLKTDEHPPSFVRPLTMRNVDAWYTAFDIQPGDKLYLEPKDRVNPW